MPEALIDILTDTETDMDDITNETVEAVEVPSTKGKRQKKAMTAHGFREGSDSAIIVDILVAGGLDRQEINDKIAAAINTQTRSGRSKNIPSLVSGLLSRLEQRGYTVESSWRVIPPR
jgi:hypothetical protein